MGIATNRCMNLKRSLSDQQVHGPRGNDQDDSAGRGHALQACRLLPMHRYAWLEHDGGLWHFLTDLFADPRDSNRRWSDQQRALDELLEEGWTVIRPYPGRPATKQTPQDKIHGYGLMRTIWVNQRSRQ
jgi:hypothetical protein